MLEPRHIAIYLPSLRGGGAERVMVNLANGFAARGHRVDLVLVKAEGPYLAEVSDKVNVIDLDRKGALASLWPLRRYLRRERPDAMLSALYHANLIAILARALGGTKTRLVVSERNSLSGLQGGVAGAVFRYLIKHLYRRTDGIVAVSRGIADELVSELGLPPERITAIPNPIDVERIAALASERPVHPWLAPDAPPVILAVGRLERQKDYPTLLAAIAQIRARREMRLIILGEGSLRPQLEQCIAEAGLQDIVMLAGFQSNPFGWMAASKVYVLSSRHEGFPNSLIQAMACGARLVSTNCPTGPDEILEGGKWGRLVPVGDADALALALTEALDDPSPINAQERLKKYQPSAVLSSYERMLV